MLIFFVMRYICYHLLVDSDISKNSHKQMSVSCVVPTCQWKITTHAVGDIRVVQVHMFRNMLIHTVDDSSSLQPALHTKRGNHTMDDVIRVSLDYFPKQICKDLNRDYDLQLTYSQA